MGTMSSGGFDKAPAAFTENKGTECFGFFVFLFFTLPAAVKAYHNHT